MEEVSTIGLDIAKSVFQAHGADEAGVSCSANGLREPRCCHSSPRSLAAWLLWRRVAAPITGPASLRSWGMMSGLFPLPT